MGESPRSPIPDGDREPGEIVEYSVERTQKDVTLALQRQDGQTITLIFTDKTILAEILFHLSRARRELD